MAPAAPLQQPVRQPAHDASAIDALRYGREYDWIGHHVAVALALIYLFLLPLATAPKDWAFGLLTLWTLIRLPHTWRSYLPLLRLPIVWGPLAWVVWQATSLLWAQNLEQGWDELKVQRMLITPLLLWPILDRAPWLVMAALAGVLAQSGVQLVQAVGWLPLQSTGEGRLRGLIHPIHSAMWFGAAIIWHLSASLNTTGWKRAASLILMLLAGVGLIATGSRGPWLAAAIALAAALVIIPMRRADVRRPAFVIGVAAILSVAAAFSFAPASLRQRVRDAQQEIALARQQQAFWTSAGLRLGLWGWAMETWRTSPIIGVGAGDFPAAYQSLDSFRSACTIATEQAMEHEIPGYAAAKAAGEDVTRLKGHRRGQRLAVSRVEYLTRDHAHSTYLHTLASQGVIGLALLLIVLALIARQCWKDRRDHPYSDGMLFVLLCWVAGAPFDCYELNGHQLGLLALVIALTLPGRAQVRWQWSAID
jgi:O-antigen ligase